MEDNRKFLIIAIPSGFIGFVVIISALTGENPIDSLFMLLGQTLLYLAGLLIFSAPVVMLIALVSVTWNEMVTARASQDEEPKRKLLSRGMKKKKKRPIKGKPQRKPAPPPASAKPVARKAKG